VDIGGARQPAARRRNRCGIDPLVSGKRLKIGFVKQKVIQNSAKEAGFAGDLTDLGRVDAGKRQKTLKPCAVGGDPSEGRDGGRFGVDGRWFTN